MDGLPTTYCPTQQAQYYCNTITSASQWEWPTEPATGFQVGEGTKAGTEATGLDAAAEEKAAERKQAFKKACDKEAVKESRHDAMKTFRKADKEAVMTARRGAAFTELEVGAESAAHPVQHGAAMTQEQVDYNAHMQQQRAVNVAIQSDDGVSTDSLLLEADARLAAGVFRVGMQAKAPSTACPEMVVID